jgi:phosphopantothenoylcysteine decarboxylase/phosphopantothenate--cysteine ligase
MNNRMYEHPATQANLEALRERGAAVVPPGRGRLASAGEWGVGRLAEPIDIFAAIEQALPGSFAPRSLDGLRVLVTAGGTQEPIDSVRYVGNRSSGRMGFAMAEAAAALGAEVTVIAANVDLARHARVRYVEVDTAEQLGAACAAEFPAADVLVMAAAVADFRPAAAVDGKVKKTGRDELALVLEPTEDVLSGLAARRGPGQTLVGFAAEHGAGALEYGRDKLTRKGLDAVVVNDVSRPGIGFDTAENEVTIVTAAGDQHVPRATKAEVARAILKTVDRLRTDAAARS